MYNLSRADVGWGWKGHLEGGKAEEGAESGSFRGREEGMS